MKAIEAVDAKRAALASEFWPVARSIFAGDEPAAEHVERVLAAAGKTTDDLRRAVRLYEKRAALVRDVQRDTEAEAEERELKALVATHENELRKAKDRFAAAARPLNDKLNELRAERHGLRGAAKALIDPRYSPDDGRRQALVDAVARLRAAEAAVAAIRAARPTGTIWDSPGSTDDRARVAAREKAAAGLPDALRELEQAKAQHAEAIEALRAV